MIPVLSSLLTRASATDWAVTVTALAAAAGVLFTFIRWARPRFRKLDAALEVLLGTNGSPADPITGAPAREPVLGIGARMSNVEGLLARHIENTERITRLEQRADDHDTAIELLRNGAIERIVTRAESTEAWRAVQAVAGQAPEDNDDTRPPITQE